MSKAKNLRKDSPTRSILKAISWRIIASGATFVISYFVMKYSTKKTDAEILQYASAIASVDVVAKLILYYLHERLWTNIYWGKYWTKKAWRRKYRKMHRKLETLQRAKNNQKSSDK
ncbi:DUF2061 domain-containing protein [Candidatus Sulfidibacterium hydrothermale]|uniref:DUF2061 domain-containing protein n=1 Tax=Candidatus Sulfidibacterium hydrothermale TaxID=2875962 RepID=UPI001F0A69E9|nr:DUF2061 domain-containing protein [Candidatus Sulfidibacterium hydrothermale]UBM61298.1 DUF2061 domain-containing protein [Candidatus Sulfidibacterium hydrothermale]